MNRGEMIERLRDRTMVWDLVVIGGGATGLGTAVDAASRGYRTALLEAHDFAQGTSSRSTKLIHGGVRYLRQGNISLVRSALRERTLLRRNAPHLVHDLPFVVPAYGPWERAWYGLGLRAYDILAGRDGLGRTLNLSRDETLEQIPTLEAEGLRGGVLYHDAQFDDARLAVNLTQAAADLGATVANYLEVIGVNKESGRISGVRARDLESGDEFEVRSRVIVNATGAFVDSVRRMDDPDALPLIVPSQGAHIVLERSFLPGESALMVPRTEDGRVLFAIPWRGRVLVGTTDTPIEEIPIEPRPREEELRFLLEHAARYLSKDPQPADVLSAYAGVRPLVAGHHGAKTAVLSRDHSIVLSGSGLVTVAGGKWTTYRKMGEDAVDRAAQVGRLDTKPCVTASLVVHGGAGVNASGDLAVYGSDSFEIEQLMKNEPLGSELLDSRVPHRAAEVIWAVRHEMARTVEDVLARRLRVLFVDARVSIKMAPKVAQIMAAELGRDRAWQEEQVAAYRLLASGYVAWD